MLLFFLPPAVQAAIGVVALVVGVVLLHSVIIAGIGIVGIAVGATRYVRSRHATGFSR